MTGSQHGDDMKAWESANEHLFCVLRLIITGVARSVLLKLKRKNGQPGDGRQAWFAYKNKYQNTSYQRVCVCVAILLILDVRLEDAPAGVTQEKGHT